MVRLVAGAKTGNPIALFDDDRVMFLRGPTAGTIRKQTGLFKRNPPFNPLDLTDEDNAMLMKALLTHG